MEFDTYFRFILVLVFVLGLVLVLGWVLKRSGISGGAIAGKGKRLAVIETAFLGPKHRLILLRRDNVEHLVLVGPNFSAVVESGIVDNATDGKSRQSFKAMVKEQAAAVPEESGQ